MTYVAKKKEMKIGQIDARQFLVSSFLLLYLLPFVTGKHREKKSCDYVIDFKIDIEKGALGCRKCRQCEEGSFQKRYKAFKSCRPCRVCHPGQYEVEQCTPTQNRKCRSYKGDEEKHNPSISSTSLQIQTTTSNSDAPKLPVAAPIKEDPRIKTSPVPLKTPEKDKFVAPKETDFEDNKSVFIVSLALSVIGNGEANTKTTDLESIEMVPLLPTRDNRGTGVMETESHEICRHNQSAGMCSNSDNSLPFMTSNFSCELAPTPEISAMSPTTFKDSGIEDGIPMLSDKRATISDVSDASDSERCDTPTYDDEHLTAAELQAVAHQLAPDYYKQVGRLLRVTENEMRIIQANNPENVEERAYEVLKKWTEKMAAEATKKNLKIALKNINRVDVVQIFYNNSKKIPNQ
ncbi:hypothetical protein KUTeg_002765 [Tegillarca granosa]|uniref:Uncharacterized protein n=1 Tax=Tegillarca granosa TaxID=220873 RepID=A0ABQ9FQZ7_TEGGR|nr:hypothetical protein KUTeg_002765 [Tegillarca granosa]